MLDSSARKRLRRRSRPSPRLKGGSRVLKARRPFPPRLGGSLAVGTPSTWRTLEVVWRSSTRQTTSDGSATPCRSTPERSRPISVRYVFSLRSAVRCFLMPFHSILQVQVHSKHDSRLPIDVTLDHRCSPMFRMTFFGIRVNVSPPSFHLKDLPDFLHDVGKGLPKTTEFSLLVPLHLSWTMDTARVILRDYPVPLFNLPAISLSDKSTAKAIEFESDLVIGEEMAGSDSFFWIPTAVIPANLGQEGAAAFELKVAKTIMPVKTYAQPTIKFNTSQVTSWGWGSSMQPGIQDMMKVFEVRSSFGPSSWIAADDSCC